MRLLVIGYGRMGRLVDQLSESYGFEVAGRLDIDDNHAGSGITTARVRDVDVAIDFSTADAVVDTLPRLAEHGVNLVVGTTGWVAEERAMRKIVEDAGIGVVAAANFSLGVNLFLDLAARAARLFEPHEEFGAWIHEVHHAAKVDAPSGTALALQREMARHGYARTIDMASTRVGAAPGTHTVGFDGPSETIALTHTTRDRATFARGALEAARWVQGRHGWFSMRDVLGLDER
ncbi:MAG: dihydrodipicolinate reductase C-terminal domain-containing protein [Acidobacteriota bacterium]|nr:dihydrodipicolinate reductase C-terminal domain-containing protein [Acidobacteriota bacterium]